MFIERLLNSGNAPIIEASARFAASRHRILAENIANVDTPGYVQKDLSIDRFREMLTDRIATRSSHGPGLVRFDDVNGAIENPAAGILYHDRNNRSMEQLMTDSVKNALFHNMMLEMLRKQFGSLEMALKERVG